MKRHTKLIYAFPAGLLLLPALAWYGAFSYRSVCTSCGEEQFATDWQIPLTRMTLWRSRSERDTPLSRVVSRYGLAKPGAHAWRFAQGSGNGAMCAVGDGRFLTCIDSTEVVEFVEAIARFRGTEEARSWLGRLLDPSQSNEAAQLIRVADIPAGGFGGREQFESWQKTQAYLFSLYFEELASRATARGTVGVPTSQPSP
jgi:hypothetical protein